MSDAEYDVTGVGNAIVDIIVQVEDSLLVDLDLTKGGMALVDEQRAAALFKAVSNTGKTSTRQAGGSAGNTVAGIESLGGRAAYVGKVAKDDLGNAFTDSLKRNEIHFATEPLSTGPRTASCLVLVTPDAQRTMCTYLGACVELRAEDIDERLIANSAVTYLEGYLFDPPHAKDAFIHAAMTAHEAGRKVSLTLSDSFCVDRHRDAFLQLVEKHVDVLFANESEIISLYQTSSFEEAATQVQGHCELAALTRSEQGSVLVAQDRRLEIPADPTQVVDTTGAGDLYAAGLLYGYTHGLPLETCGRLGSLAAAEVISHVGGRPQQRLRDMAAERGLLK